MTDLTTAAYVRDKAVPILETRLVDAVTIWEEAASTGLSLPGAAALLEKESGGRNVYGHDAGGALSGFPGEVHRHNFEVFWWLVDVQGQPSNGVGPCQLTYPGFFHDMLATGMKPWVAAQNMRYGFTLLKGYHDHARSSHDTHPWVTAGRKYNGSLDYGRDLATKVGEWIVALHPARRS